MPPKNSKSNIIPPIDQSEELAARAVVEEQNRRLEEMLDRQRAHVHEVFVAQQERVQQLFQQQADAVHVLQQQAQEAAQQQLEAQSRQLTGQLRQVAQQHGQVHQAQNTQAQHVQHQGLQIRTHRGVLNGHLHAELLRLLHLSDVQQDFLQSFRQQFLHFSAHTGREQAVQWAQRPPEVVRMFADLFNPRELRALGPRFLHEQTAEFGRIVANMIDRLYEYLHGYRMTNPEGSPSHFPAFNASTPNLLVQQVYATFFENVNAIREILFANEDDRQARRPVIQDQVHNRLLNSGISAAPEIPSASQQNPNSRPTTSGTMSTSRRAGQHDDGDQFSGMAMRDPSGTTESTNRRAVQGAGRSLPSQPVDAAERHPPRRSARLSGRSHQTLVEDSMEEEEGSPVDGASEDDGTTWSQESIAESSSTFTRHSSGTTESSSWRAGHGARRNLPTEPVDAAGRHPLRRSARLSGRYQVEQVESADTSSQSSASHRSSDQTLVENSMEEEGSPVDGTSGDDGSTWSQESLAESSSTFTRHSGGTTESSSWRAGHGAGRDLPSQPVDAAGRHPPRRSARLSGRHQVEQEESTVASSQSSASHRSSDQTPVEDSMEEEEGSPVDGASEDDGTTWSQESLAESSSTFTRHSSGTTESSSWRAGHGARRNLPTEPVDAAGRHPLRRSARLSGRYQVEQEESTVASSQSSASHRSSNQTPVEDSMEEEEGSPVDGTSEDDGSTWSQESLAENSSTMGRHPPRRSARLSGRHQVEQEESTVASSQSSASHRSQNQTPVGEETESSSTVTRHSSQATEASQDSGSTRPTRSTSSERSSRGSVMEDGEGSGEERILEGDQPFDDNRSSRSSLVSFRRSQPTENSLPAEEAVKKESTSNTSNGGPREENPSLTPALKVQLPLTVGNRFRTAEGGRPDGNDGSSSSSSSESAPSGDEFNVNTIDPRVDDSPKSARDESMETAAAEEVLSERDSTSDFASGSAGLSGQLDDHTGHGEGGEADSDHNSADTVILEGDDENPESTEIANLLRTISIEAPNADETNVAERDTSAVPTTSNYTAPVHPSTARLPPSSPLKRSHQPEVISLDSGESQGEVDAKKRWKAERDSWPNGWATDLALAKAWGTSESDSKDEVVSNVTAEPIRRHDLLTLRDGNMVNDLILENYLSLLVKSAQEDLHKKSFSFFHAHLGPLLVKREFSRLNALATELGAFNSDVIVFPLCHAQHWVVAYIHTSAGKVQMFNSYLRCDVWTAVLPQFQEWLRTPEKLKNKAFKIELCRTPQQPQNSLDCALFVLEVVRYWSENRPLDFSSNFVTSTTRLRVAKELLSGRMRKGGEI